MPTVKIKIPVHEIWLSTDDFDGYDCEEYDYEYDLDILHEEILECFINEYKVSIDTANAIIEDEDLWDLYEERYEEEINDSLQERLYEAAYEEWSNHGE